VGEWLALLDLLADKNESYFSPPKLSVILLFMKLCLIALLLLASSTANFAAEVDIVDRLGVTEADGRLPGVALAEGVSQLTGVAVSPLLGVSIIGTWKYFTTPEELRDTLPWICHPIFWCIGFGVLLLCFFKDTIGAIAPAFVKKPLDFLELFEDKFSAIIAGSAFVPFLVQQYTAFAPTSSGMTEGTAMIPTPILAVIDPVWIWTPIALVGFFTVWIVSHAVTTLAALSPFRILEVFLKGARLALLGFVGLLYVISPVLAAILCVILMVICAFLAPKAFRLSVYGTVVGLDLVRSLIHKRPLDREKIRGFLMKRGSRLIKAGSFGKAIPCEEGALVFRSRWAFVGVDRKLRFPSETKLVLTKGLLFPTIRIVDENGSESTVIHLLPSARHHADEIAAHLGLEVRETPVTKGFRSARKWVSDTFSRSSIPGVSTSSG